LTGQGREHREATNPTARRELTAAVLASAAAGGLAVFAGGQTWATLSAVRPAPLPPVTGVLAGSTHAPLVPAAGLVLLAAAVALLAVRAGGRTAVGVLMTISGLALAWTAGRALAGGLRDAAAEVPVVVGTPVAEISTVWPATTAVAGLLGALAGVVVVVRGRRWPAMGSRYERGTAAGAGTPVPPRPRTDEERVSLAWNALDRGEDPTDPASSGPGVRPV
jgi:uncharacterized membrane protein (TIGR02234 family)